MKTLAKNRKVLLNSGETAVILKKAVTLDNGYLVEIDGKKCLVDADEIRLIGAGGNRPGAGRKKVKDGITTSLYLSKSEYMQFKKIYGFKVSEKIDLFIKDHLSSLNLVRSSQ